MIINSHGNGRGSSLFPYVVQVPITIQETGDLEIHKLLLLSSQASMVHEGTPKNEDLFESLTENM